MGVSDSYNARVTKQDGAWDLLRPEQRAWNKAHEECQAAKKAYLAKAEANGLRLCDHCAKPMPGYDSSQNCDGCHLPWGWATSEGRKARRAAALKAEIAARQAALEVLEGLNL